MDFTARSMTAALAVIAAWILCACSTNSPAPQTSPSSDGSVTPSPTASPSPRAEKVYVAADLPAIVLTPAEMAGWQTATRPDLSGPFTVTTNTNPQESPAPAASLRAGYRQTIGDPGGPGINTIRTVLELFDSPSDAQAALRTTVSGYESAGYNEQVDASGLGLGPDAAARSGVSAPTAPQFAQGTVKQGMVLVWRSGNLLLIQVVGGDSGVTLEAAAKWVQLVQANAQSHWSGGPNPPPAGWMRYTHPKWGYALWYPSTWFELDSFGPRDTAKYFANERVGAPLELDAKGIWLTISVADGACPAPPSPASGQKQVLVGGQPVTRTSGHSAPPAGEGAWTIGADVPESAKCFSFRYMASTQEARDANLDIADQMISSFRAGVG